LAGAFVARIGDVNGDGKQDFAIGAPDASDGGQYAGAVYVILGTGKRLASAMTLPAGPVVRGDLAGRRVGFTFARVGDFDGDGRDDFLVGTSTVLDAKNGAGEAYVIRGRDSLPSVITASQEIVFFGEKPGDLAGVSVAGLGDLDGDGRGDIAIGAVRGDGDEPSAGRVYFARGRAVPPGSRLPLSSELVVAKGKKSTDHLGEVIRGADTDGDGSLDLLIAARGEAVGTTVGAGAIHIVAGKGLGGR
jgi:glycosylphosphatidylinositol phospholipase D